MSIKFQCHNCFWEYSVKDEMAGKSVKCRECNAGMIIPSVQASQSSDFLPIAEPSEKFTAISKEKIPIPSTTPKRSSVKLKILTTISLCLIVVIVVIALLFSGNNRKKKPISTDNTNENQKPISIEQKVEIFLIVLITFGNTQTANTLIYFVILSQKCFGLARFPD